MIWCVSVIYYSDMIYIYLVLNLQQAGDAPIGTMRQTNVVVIPNCEEIAQFRTFDTLIQAINQARRRAREFVVKMDKDQTKDDNLGKDWVVSINCAHLHPQYGMQTPEEQLTSMKHEEEEGEVDLNLQEYKKQRDEARRSPYPSVIVEVQSTPPPDFGAAAAATEAKAAAKQVKSDPNKYGLRDTMEDDSNPDFYELPAFSHIGEHAKGYGKECARDREVDFRVDSAHML